LKFSSEYDTLNMMKKEVFKKDLAKIVSISKKYGAEKVFLFGSCLEKVESARDIDIAVKGVKPERFFEMYGKILGAVASEIDLIPLEDIREHFAKRILETGRLLYGN
jgi:predicted nucleotidyltransferase